MIIINKFVSYSKALSEVQKLNAFIQLVEGYKITSREEWVIKNYACTNSITGVLRNSYLHSSGVYSSDIDREFVKSVLSQSPKDDLHKIVSQAYKSKSKNRKKV